MSELPYANRLVRIGVQLQPQHADDYVDLARAVDAAGGRRHDVIFTWDHFFPLRRSGRQAFRVLDDARRLG